MRLSQLPAVDVYVRPDKAEWAFRNGVKQAAGSVARSREQLRAFTAAEIEFRLARARSVALNTFILMPELVHYRTFSPQCAFI